jgi:hypothetical protein
MLGPFRYLSLLGPPHFCVLGEGLGIICILGPGGGGGGGKGIQTSGEGLGGHNSDEGTDTLVLYVTYYNPSTCLPLAESVEHTMFVNVLYPLIYLI